MNALLRILAAHHMTVISHTKTTITVEAVYCKDGYSFVVPETIDATPQAVSDWLGY